MQKKEILLYFSGEGRLQIRTQGAFYRQVFQLIELLISSRNQSGNSFENIKIQRIKTGMNFYENGRSIRFL